MSKKNIIDRKVVGNKVQLTFETDSGYHTYEYGGVTKRALERGKDPASLIGGKFIGWEKKKD